ncbi:MAG TPA: DUF488 domain-containing protein [Candidatus Paceibacterota bacterium]
MYTIGHSTRSIDEFVGLLKRNHIALLCDVRSIPKSRHVPQFGQGQLPQSLAEAGIEYCWMHNLGGRRHTTKDSPNMGWRNASFRGYADYMQTPEFTAALNELEELASHKRVAIMCAEAVPWRCHRSLIADALTTEGWRVLTIIDEHEPKEHKLNPMARVEGTTITYPPQQSELL